MWKSTCHTLHTEQKVSQSQIRWEGGITELCTSSTVQLGPNWRWEEGEGAWRGCWPVPGQTGLPHLFTQAVHVKPGLAGTFGIDGIRNEQHFIPAPSTKFQEVGRSWSAPNRMPPRAGGNVGRCGKTPVTPSTLSRRSANLRYDGRGV